jgi:DNA-binding transcriptional LysR family regulator
LKQNKHLPLASLRAIDNIRKTGSISITAQQLGLTQSAISRSIATLEEHLGVPLLNRGRRPLDLTSEGELVAQSATRIEQELEVLQSQLDDRKRHRSGRVTIGSFGASASSRLLPHLLQRFHHKHPGIAVSVIDGDDQQTEKSLHEGLFDFAVLGKAPNECDCISLCQDQLVGLIPSEHALAKRKKLSAVEFHQQPFVMPQAGGAPKIRRWLDTADAQPDVRHQVHQIGGILALVKAGLALSIVAEMVLPETPLEGVAVISLQPTVPRHIVMARPKTQALSQAAQCFWEFTAKAHSRAQ